MQRVSIWKNNRNAVALLVEGTEKDRCLERIFDFDWIKEADIIDVWNGLLEHDGTYEVVYEDVKSLHYYVVMEKRVEHLDLHWLDSFLYVAREKLDISPWYNGG